jgi:hypothetical protein
LKERPAKSAYMSETKTFSCIIFTHIGAFGGEKRFFAKVTPLGWWKLQNNGPGLLNKSTTLVYSLLAGIYTVTDDSGVRLLLPSAPATLACATPPLVSSSAPRAPRHIAASPAARVFAMRVSERQRKDRETEEGGR